MKLIRFGEVGETCVLMVSVPHTLVMVIWQVAGFRSYYCLYSPLIQVGCSVAILRIIPAIGGEEAPLSRYYHTWGPWLAGLYLAAVPVQVNIHNERETMIFFSP